MTGRAVLTTGANSGLGLATVLELARRGFRSIGTARTEAKADVVRKAARDAGVTVEVVLLDVTDAAGCTEVVEGIEDLYGLVNNAGIGVTGAIEETSDDEARAVIETMLIAPMRLARLAIAPMRAGGGGRIVNISSIYGRTTTPLTGWYQAAKHGLEGATDALRMEVARDGIAVSLVEPGAFKTAIFDDAKRDIDMRGASSYRTGYERTLQVLRMSSPMMGDPNTVARLVATICSTRYPRARYLVGNDAQVLALADRLTPTFVKDIVIRRTFGL
ncbi:MAG TPA: SDR family NAD(P)-dependent oxidoreductase [Acidimicrobiales bacterium]